MADYSENDEESEEAEESTPSPKKNQDKKRYVISTTYPDHEAAHKDVEEEAIWAKAFCNDNKSGFTQYFRCKKVAFRGCQCDAGVKLVYHVDSLQVTKFVTTKGHSCDSISTKARSFIPEAAKEKMKELFRLRVPPRIVVDELQSMGITLKVSQVYNFRKQYNMETYGQTLKYLGELFDLIIEHDSVPDDAKKPFILNHMFEHESSESYRFNFVVSSKALLENAKYVPTGHLCADGTYKLIWEGFTVLVVGSTDKHNSFHPFGISVTTNETTADYEFVFTSIKNAVEKLMPGISFEPKHLQSDAARQIHNGFRNVFGEDATNSVCFFHVKSNIQKQVSC